MNGRQERERQQGATCCARSSSNGWSSAPAAVTGTRRLRPLDRGWHTLPEFTFVADGWQRSDGRMVRTTSAFLMRWTKRGLGLRTEHLAPGARDPAPVGRFASGPERGRFPWRPRSILPCPLPHPVRSNMRLFRSRPSLYDALYLTPYQVRWWPIAFGTLSPPRTDCSETLEMRSTVFPC